MHSIFCQYLLGLVFVNFHSVINSVQHLLYCLTLHFQFFSCDLDFLLRKLIQFNSLNHLVVPLSGTSQRVAENQTLSNTVAAIAWNGGTEPVPLPGW